MAKEFGNKTNQHSDNKDTFSVVMPNQTEHAANYRKVNGEEKTKK